MTRLDKFIYLNTRHFSILILNRWGYSTSGLEGVYKWEKASLFELAFGVYASNLTQDLLREREIVGVMWHQLWKRLLEWKGLVVTLYASPFGVERSIRQIGCHFISLTLWVKICLTPWDWQKAKACWLWLYKSQPLELR